MNRILKYGSLGLFIFLVTAMAPGCSSKGPITVGSLMDTETGLLAQMIILMLRDNGFEVTDGSNLENVRDLMEAREVDIYPDYTGDGANYYEDPKDVPDKNVWRDPEKGYQTIKELDKKTDNFAWLNPAPANDIWAIAIPKAMAEKNNIYNMEQFKNYVNEGGPVKLAASQTFVEDEYALPAYEKTYGFTLSEDQLVIIPGASSWDTENMASDNVDGVNAAMAYSTDGNLDRLDLVILDDTLGAQIVFAPAPVVRGDILKKYPEIEGILEPVFEKLDDTTLQNLNSQTGFAGGEVSYLVARDYLMDEKQHPKYVLSEDPSGLPKVLPPYTADLPDPQNQQIKEIINTMMVVGPNSLVEKSFTANVTEEDNGRLVGWFLASGGALNDIRVLVLNDIDFINWKNLHTVDGLYKSEKLTTDKIDKTVATPGEYHLVFDNRFSQFSRKYVLAKFYLYWSKDQDNNTGAENVRRN
jgi:osmoprotectant transport system substrate-binding protein